MSGKDLVPTRQTGRAAEGDLAVRGFRVFTLDGASARVDVASDGQCPLRIGRSGHGNQVVLADHEVSRFHCELVARAEGVLVRDLGSTNGTGLGALRLRGQEAWIDPSGAADLRVGALTLRVAIASAAERVKTSPRTRFGAMVGTSPVMRALFAELEALARSSLPVLLLGEPGVGKELAARALHDEGPRAAEPFVVIDCSSITPSLLESELFGHEKGAFTGAAAARESPFVTAGAGTVFLDEIGELPLEAQSRLLRVLQEREVRAVGGARARKVRARLVCATNRDLFREIERGRFREDLFHRIAGVEVEVPPLRERGAEDLDVLVDHLIEGLRREEPLLADAALPDDVRARLRAMRWPGNVRELGMTLRRYFVLSRVERRVLRGEREEGGGDPPMRLADALDLAEAAHVRGALERVAWNQTRAAERLGVSRMTLITKMKKHGIKTPAR